MPKKYRLTGEEIRKLSGKRFHSIFFSLLVAPIPAKHAKYAVVVSKKIAADAVDRNRIKRRMRAILSKHISTAQRPAALVFYAKRETKDAAFSQIERDINLLLAKV